MSSRELAHDAGLDDALRRVVALEEEVKHRALHDPLTGLPNRDLFADRLALTLARARRGGPLPAVLIADLDQFKLINDSMGHQAGDELLREAARRIAAGVRATDTDAGDAGRAIRGGQTTGEPCALKVASTVRRGADGKGRSRLPVTADASRAHEPRHQPRSRQPPTLLNPNPQRCNLTLAATASVTQRHQGRIVKLSRSATSDWRGDEERLH